MSLQKSLNDFYSTINKSNRLIAKAHTQKSSGRYVWSLADRQLITESSFLRIFKSWEFFLEKSFLYYLTGGKSLTGKRVICYAKPKNHLHAIQFSKGTNKYADWTDQDKVRELAKIFFKDGEPFSTTLASINSDLVDLKIIRNAIAHNSKNVFSKLDGLGNRKLHRPCVNLSVYDLILAIDPANLSHTVLETYTSILQAAASQIANN